jgi:hypothetical protein
MMRNLFIAAVASFLANQVNAQLMLLVLVISSFYGLQCILWPWRSDLVNMIDMVFAVGLLLIVTGGCRLSDTGDDDSQVVVRRLRRA